MRKGDVYLAELDPTRGSEQAGTRPVVVFQKDILTKFTRTVIVIAFTTNGLLVPGGDETDRGRVSFYPGHVCKIVSKIRLARPSRR